MFVELIEALRTTGAVRQFDGRPIADDVVQRILDTARFAPNGGNGQELHVLLVKDPASRGAFLPGSLQSPAGG